MIGESSTILYDTIEFYSHHYQNLMLVAGIYFFVIGPTIVEINQENKAAATLLYESLVYGAGSILIMLAIMAVFAIISDRTPLPNLFKFHGLYVFSALLVLILQLTHEFTEEY